jgi:hypothetical protein
MSQVTAVAAREAAQTGGQAGFSSFVRWLPAAVTFFAVAAVLAAADTSVPEIVRYATYALLAVVFPGTLVYRALRRVPHTLVEDLAMGAAVGLTLELIAWAVFSALDLRGWVWLWPAAVAALFLAVPALRRHWRVRGYTPVPVAWSWSLASIVIFWTTYLSAVFLERNPIVPASEDVMQYMDLSYQLSLAGEAKNHLPLHLPQVAGEPLYYHWFAYAHMAMASMVGGVDLAAVSLRFAVPALCALAIVLTAVVGWRVSRRSYVGIGAAVLFFVVGEFNFTHPVTMPFGTQATFVIWHGMSMIYSWVLLIALIAVLADLVARMPVRASRLLAATGAGGAGADATGADGADGARAVPAIGPGAYMVAALLIFASSGSKASSLPIVLGALAVTGVVLLVANRRVPWPVVILGVLSLAAQFFATAMLYDFQTYGTEVFPFASFETFYLPEAGLHRAFPVQAAITAAVFAAFFLNMQLRQAGIIPLLRGRRGRLEPVQWLLLGGALAGVVFYMSLKQLSGGQQYFARSGFAFGVILSAWGFAEAFDRARLGRRGKALLGAGAAAAAAGTVLGQLLLARPQPATNHRYDAVLPIIWWAGILMAMGALAALAWFPARRHWTGLRGRGGIVVLTAVLVTGAPGLVMDMYKSMEAPNGGAYHNVSMPRSHVVAARWVREHSRPGDVLATNAHCLYRDRYWGCDARSFWLSAYSERRVLVEGWTFAPRLAGEAFVPFWDQELLKRNDQAFIQPTAQKLAELTERYGVRWLVADVTSGPVSPALADLADLRYQDGRISVYELR